MNTKKVGNIGEAKILAKFVEMGIPVYLPFGDNEKADLIAEFHGKLNKIQIKASSIDSDGVMKFSVCSRASKSQSMAHTYTENEVDYFAFYNIPRNEYLLIAFKDCQAKDTIAFRYEKPKNNQSKGINMNYDFTFEKILNP